MKLKCAYRITSLLLIVCCFFLTLPPQYVLAKPKITIVIDPGHGGVDPGTMKGNIREKDITLDISKRVQKILTGKGYNVILTRKSDVAPSSWCKNGDTRVVRDLNARVDTINKSGAKVFLSIHVNSAYNYPNENGSIVFYWPTSKKSKSLATYIQGSLNSVTLGGKKRMAHNPRSADFYILKKTKIPGVLIETGFISNPAEREMMTQSKYKQDIANGIAKGLEQYVKLN
jgi:N-acetylmuramoyl-L-alanine amidase